MTILALIVVWLAFGCAACWIMLDSVYGSRRLPGIDSPWGLLAMVGWLVVISGLAVAISTWATA